MPSCAQPLPRTLTPRTRRRGWHSALALALVLVGQSRSAAAQSLPPSQGASTLAAGTRRELPDYDGRGQPRVSGGQVAAWIPRVALFPLVLTVEVVRRPLGAVLTPPVVTHAFESAAGVAPEDPGQAPRGPTFSVAPLVRFESDRRPEVGLLLGVDALGEEHNRLFVSAATGGERDYVGELWDFVAFRGGDVGVRGTYTERPDNPFYGALGPDTLRGTLSRYWERRAGAFATASLRFGRMAGLYVQSGVRYTDVDLSTLPADAVPQGGERYSAFVTDAEAWFDTRGNTPVATSGLRVSLRLHHGADLARVADRRWLVAEGMAGAYVEVKHPGRVLGAEVYAALATPLGSDAVPFAELPALGGAEPLRGFLEGRFRGPSAIAASVLYRWPVWIWLEAELRVGVGNAFGADFAGFDPAATFGSGNVVLRTAPGGTTHFELLAGAGTTRFDDPHFGVASGRFLFALTRGF